MDERELKEINENLDDLKQEILKIKELGKYLKDKFSRYTTFYDLKELIKNQRRSDWKKWPDQPCPGYFLSWPNIKYLELLDFSDDGWI